MRATRLCVTTAAITAGLLLHSVPASAGDAQTAAAPPAFRVDGDRVDPGTLNGYRRYGNSCQPCHGPDAIGSSFAPALMNSLKTMDYPTFKATVTAGRMASPTSVMPAFKSNTDVMTNLDDIYRYLSARAVGGLPPGRPHKLEE